MLMLLQSRKRITAETLAEELEVSPRTIYRDLIALSTSGIPVYCERGPGGGIFLLEDYRTTLTGLKPDEMKALFMLSTPPALAQLGVEKNLKAAMLKLYASLPESGRQYEESTRERILIDPAWWYHPTQAAPSLEIIQQALWEDKFLQIRFLTFQNALLEHQVAPYGLVAKGSEWFMVYGWKGSIKIRNTSSIIEAHLLEETFTRPVGFDLEKFWKHWLHESETIKPYMVRVRLSAAILPTARYHLDERYRHLVNGMQKPSKDGWVVMELPFASLNDARTRLLGMGRAVEVLEPEALRKSILDFANQVVELYQGQTP
jgi:predicted DNA-binding transcriptional regulator YafY